MGGFPKPGVSAVWPRVAGVSCLLASLLGGCSERVDSAWQEASAPIPEPALRSPDGVFGHEGLLDIARLGLRRDGAGLLARLADPDPRIRARAAFTLASVGGEDVGAALLPLLRDSVPQVRRDAAFALGRVGVPDGGLELLRALSGEVHGEVRERLMEALGLQGRETVLEPLLAMVPREGEGAAMEEHAAAGMSGDVGEASLYLALARISLREIEEPSAMVLETLVRGLRSPGRDAWEVREAAAHYFALHPNPASWEPVLPQVRETLEGFPRDEPAAMLLLHAMSRRRDPAGLGLIKEWLREGEDFRIRVNAARALGTAWTIEQPGVREALWEAVERDPAEPVAEAAARSLQVGLRVPASVLARAEAMLLAGSVPNRRILPFLPVLATSWNWEPVLEWTRRQAEEDPAAAASGIRALGYVADIPVTGFLFEMARHPDVRVRAASLGALNGRWTLVLGPGEELERYFQLFRGELEGRELPSAVHATRALSHPAFRHLGGVELLAGALRELSAQVQEGNGSRQMARGGDPSRAVLLSELRAALTVAGESIPPPPPVLAPDVESDLPSLADLGPDPVLVLDTERGTLRVRLAPEEAPLSVWTLVRVVEEDGWNGVPFHRVEPNFVVQGGDAAAWEGTGFTAGPGAFERTSIPFRRGAVGLASVGSGMEGLQFFITHSHQPQLDVEHTAFGWVVEGGEVLDRIRTGDRILRAGVQPVR